MCARACVRVCVCVRVNVGVYKCVSVVLGVDVLARVCACVFVFEGGGAGGKRYKSVHVLGGVWGLVGG